MRQNILAFFFSILFLNFVSGPRPAIAETPVTPAEMLSPTLPEETEEEVVPPSALQLAAEKYFTGVSQKIDFGTSNFIAGWTQIISQPLDHYRNAGQKSRVLDGFTGLGKGLLLAPIDTAGGLLSVATAPLPWFQIPLPENGVSISRITGETEI